MWATKLTDNSATAKEQLGIKRIEWDSSDSCFKAYRYVQAASDTTVADGTALCFTDTLRQVVSSDISDADNNQPAGVGIGAITASYYGWVQTGGYHSAVLTNGDDDIADGDHIILDDSNDGVVDSVSAGTACTDTQVGIAVADDVDGSNTVAVFLTLDDC